MMNQSSYKYQQEHNVQYPKGIYQSCYFDKIGPFGSVVTVHRDAWDKVYINIDPCQDAQAARKAKDLLTPVQQSAQPTQDAVIQKKVEDAVNKELSELREMVRSLQHRFSGQPAAQPYSRNNGFVTPATQPAMPPGQLFNDAGYVNPPGHGYVSVAQDVEQLKSPTFGLMGAIVKQTPLTPEQKQHILSTQVGSITQEFNPNNYDDIGFSKPE